MILPKTMQRSFLSSWLFLVLLFGLGPAAPAQQSFEIGGLVLATAYRSAEVRSGPAAGSVGFRPGPAGGAFVGQNLSDQLGGELRYLYMQNDLKLSSGGAKTTFSGRCHVINYDLLVYPTGRGARTSLYLAGGGGVKYYQGTGTEQPFQPLSNLAILTRTNEALLTVDFGGGLRIQASERVSFRAEFRDYITKVPKVFGASPGAKISGIFHQWAPAFGVSWTF